MLQERKGAVTFQNNPLTLVGPELRAGDQAPDFEVVNGSLQPVTLASSSGKTRLVSVVPSIDTPVCDLQTKRFNQEAAKLGNNITILTISMDLPFAQARWCGAAGIDKVQMLSDYQKASFGTAYGVLVKELRLLCRGIFVIGPDNMIKYVEYVKEITTHPDYDSVLKFLKS